MGIGFNQIGNWSELAEISRYSAANLAKRCKASLRQLERYFLHEKGRSPRQWLSELRQQKALQLIRAGWTLKEVAAQLAYSHAPNFSRDFKRYHGVSPAQMQHALAQMSCFDNKCRAMITDLPSAPIASVGKLPSVCYRHNCTTRLTTNEEKDL